MEQSLESDDKYNDVKEKSSSIELIKMFKRICYNYQSYEYPPLGAWEVIDRLGHFRQPSKGMSKADHYESFKTMVEVCKANDVNFAVLYGANVYMATKILFKQSKVLEDGIYKDGTYFKLTKDDRKLVDGMVEEICMSTRFLVLSSNELHSTSKQELKNDIVKSDDKYPCTISSTINFLQYHSLRNKAPHI